MQLPFHKNRQHLPAENQSGTIVEIKMLVCPLCQDGTLQLLFSEVHVRVHNSATAVLSC